MSLFDEIGKKLQTQGRKLQQKQKSLLRLQN